MDGCGQGMGKLSLSGNGSEEAHRPRILVSLEKVQ